LMALFYDVLHYEPKYRMKKTAHGKERRLTTDEEALHELAEDGYKEAMILDEHREIEKLKGTYMEGLIVRVDPLNYVHTNFMQAFTGTGRLSSRDPNLQNIPRRNTDRFMIRAAFIAPPGHYIVGADYGQIEVRLMAHISRDAAMIRACMEADIYETMAAIIFNKPPSFFAKNNEGFRSHEAESMRDITKIIVLGVGFGKQAKSIARDLNISEAKAEKFLKMYFRRFPRFAAWMQKQIREGRHNGFVRTIAGRYRRLPDLQLPRTKDNWYRITHAERQALNFPMQGGAWEIMKQSLLNMRQSGILEKYDASMFLTVHDELLNYVPKTAAKEFAPKFKEIMEHPFQQDLRVPLSVKTYQAMNWAEGK
jgi:DNA polymerase-1